MNYELKEMGQQLVCNSASLQQTALSIEVDQEVPFTQPHRTAQHQVASSSSQVFCHFVSLFHSILPELLSSFQPPLCSCGVRV